MSFYLPISSVSSFSREIFHVRYAESMTQFVIDLWKWIYIFFAAGMLVWIVIWYNSEAGLRNSEATHARGPVRARGWGMGVCWLLFLPILQTYPSRYTCSGHSFKVAYRYSFWSLLWCWRLNNNSLVPLLCHSSGYWLLPVAHFAIKLERSENAHSWVTSLLLTLTWKMCCACSTNILITLNVLEIPVFHLETFKDNVSSPNIENENVT